MFPTIRCSVLSAYTLIIFIHTWTLVSCLNASDANRLYSRLLTDYNRKLLPLQNQSDAAEVDVFVYLISINSFDELSGELAFAVLFNFTWREERMSWSPKDFDGKTSLLVAPEDVWRPKLFVRESVDNVQEVGNISDMLRLEYDGYMVWTVGSVLKVICSVDVTFFPFDSHTCTVTLSTVTVRSDELKFRSLTSYADTTIWTNNSQWTYQGSNIFSFAIPDGQSGIILHITLKRRSEFYTIYIIIPLVFLGMINNLVFFMPAHCGERSSVAMTSFLSFAVYMQIVNSNVPQSSAPIANIYYYLMFLLIYSSYIMLACIVSMRIHDKEGKIPVFIKNVVLVLRCRCCKRRNKSVTLNTTDPPDSTIENLSTEIPNQESKAEEYEVTWTLVGRTFDTYFGVFNFLFFVSFTWISFIMLYLNKGIPGPEF